MLGKLGYDKKVPLEFNNKCSCGLWFIIIGIVIMIATFLGGNLLINPPIFCIGYFVGFYIAIVNKKVRGKLSCGERIPFQKKMSSLSILLLSVLIVLFTFSYWGTANWKMIWLLCFLAVGIHFFTFYFVHGKSMIWIGFLCSISAILGILFKNIPFIYFAYIDGIIKLCFGIFLLFFSKPTKSF